MYCNRRKDARTPDSPRISHAVAITEDFRESTRDQRCPNKCYTYDSNLSDTKYKYETRSNQYSLRCQLVGQSESEPDPEPSKPSSSSVALAISVVKNGHDGTHHGRHHLVMHYLVFALG